MCSLTGQLLDRGFTGVRRFYPTHLVSYHPAHVKDRKKGGVTLTVNEVIDSAVQAADRYGDSLTDLHIKHFDTPPVAVQPNRCAC